MRPIRHILALLAMTTLSSHAEPGPTTITGFSIEPATAEFGTPVEAGTAIGLSVSGDGQCRVTFLARPADDPASGWHEAATAAGALPLAARLDPLPPGEHWLTFRADCHAAKFRQEFRVRVLDRSEQPRLLGFSDREAKRCNQLTLGTPPRITPRRTEEGVAVNVLANFGCQTTAGNATVQRDGSTLVLSAHTILPDFPTPHCLCTRELEFRASGRDVKRVRYVQDSRPAVEIDLPD